VIEGFSVFGRARRFERCDIRVAEVLDGEHSAVAALQTPVFVDREQHAAVAPVPRHRDRLAQGDVLIASDVALEIGGGDFDHALYPLACMLHNLCVLHEIVDHPPRRPDIEENIAGSHPHMLGRGWAVVAWMAGTSPARTRKDESRRPELGAGPSEPATCAKRAGLRKFDPYNSKGGTGYAL
jgi:hypothetical protein